MSGIFKAFPFYLHPKSISKDAMKSKENEGINTFALYRAIVKHYCIIKMPCVTVGIQQWH
jgi:hypothetical protein